MKKADTLDLSVVNDRVHENHKKINFNRWLQVALVKIIAYWILDVFQIRFIAKFQCC